MQLQHLLPVLCLVLAISHISVASAGSDRGQSFEASTARSLLAVEPLGPLLRAIKKAPSCSIMAETFITLAPLLGLNDSTANYTIFLPNNKAVKDFQDQTMQKLSSVPAADLLNILKYHISPPAQTVASIMAGADFLPTLLPNKRIKVLLFPQRTNPVALQGSGIKDRAAVVKEYSDIKAGNSWIQVVNSILTVPSAIPEPPTPSSSGGGNGHPAPRAQAPPTYGGGSFPPPGRDAAPSYPPIGSAGGSPPPGRTTAPSYPPIGSAGGSPPPSRTTAPSYPPIGSAGGSPPPSRTTAPSYPPIGSAGGSPPPAKFNGVPKPPPIYAL